MHLTDIRIDEIVKVNDLPCYAHGYGDDAVCVYSPTNGKELRA